ncbi:MAG: fumarylacetoacetate hydrolase family protein [Bacteroidia bacterium]
MKIFCIGRNYAEHAKELQNEVPQEPVIFMKPPTALLKYGLPFFLPDFSDDVHYEAELVLKITRQGKHIQEKFAHKYFDHISLGIDFTARDIQQRLKQKGLPWEISKGFDGSAAVGDFVPLEDFPAPITFHLEIDGKTVQQSDTSFLLFSFSRLISFISQYFTLQTGDLIYTGTPAGVGKVYVNNHLTGYVEDQKVLDLIVK